MDSRSVAVWVIAGVFLAMVFLANEEEIVTAVTTGLSRSGFLSLVGGEVERQLSELRPDLTDAQRRASAAIVAAQAAHETGYGRGLAWREGWNFGNITAGSSWNGEIVTGGDLDGAGKPITQAFRKYGSLAEAVSDFFVLLSWTRYRPARDSLMAGDVAGYVARLRSAGYFTAPESSYLAGVRAAIPAATGVLS